MITIHLNSWLTWSEVPGYIFLSKTLFTFPFPSFDPTRMRFCPTCSMTQKFYLKSVKWTWSGARTALYLQTISTSERDPFCNKRWKLEFDYGQLQMKLILLTQLENIRLTKLNLVHKNAWFCNPLVLTFHIDFIKTKRFKWHSHTSIFVYMEIFICKRTSAHECTDEMQNKIDFKPFPPSGTAKSGVLKL